MQWIRSHSNSSILQRFFAIKERDLLSSSPTMLFSPLSLLLLSTPLLLSVVADEQAEYLYVAGRDFVYEGAVSC